MGFFVTLNGEFSCIRCGSVPERSIQTKLFRTGADNSCQPYRVGDTEILDGLCDYHRLCAWSHTGPLVVLVGDWDCDDCTLSWQWARAVFDVSSGQACPATIIELSGVQRNHADDLAGVHYIEPDFANLPDSVNCWANLSVKSRCELLASGFCQWCVDVAGIQPKT